MTGAFLAGLVAGYGVAIPVGAIAVLILGLSARTSFRVGAAGALGVATADGLYAAVAAVAGAAVAGVVEPVAGPLRMVAAAVLLALAAHTAWRALRPAPVTGARSRRGLDTPLRAFAGILALTLLNPATVVYFAALVLGRGDAADPGVSTAVLFVLGAFMASASWQLLIAGGGTLVGRILTGTRGRRAIAITSSAIITILALTVLLST
ncbi:Arginine exporter protein ArgO [Micromonospora coriariae]|uniref:Arginine exporter protein ArgO n=1 Tax=Micromonospora coriariae TaxID=285665 RepID=A0A1C4WZ35_9ACTN|nr:LysE family transporter [Micromonospora coriariae]SCF01517.1 Arginine exporter protein ArgO [Micromonospora coriariae]